MNVTACFRWALLLSALVLHSVATGYEGTIKVGEQGERIVAFVRRAHNDAGFSGAVLAARDGKVIAAVAVGTTDAQKGKPLTVDTLFEIASCTKPFTAIAVMKLVEAGKLDLDDSISEYLPGIPDSCRDITVRHLLQHTSGIPGTNSQGRGTELAEVLPTFLAGGPRTTPGEKHEYWNQGYALLSEIIARASGKTYTQYMRDAVLKPCKMESTRFTGQRAPRGLLVATGTATHGASRTALEHPYGEYGFQYRGMGGLVTNLIDLWRWDRSLARGKLLGTETLEEMTRPGEAGYALGWRIKELESGDVVHEHTGSVRGFLASIRRNPAEDGCLFVLANSDAPGPFHFVKGGCENLLEGQEPPDAGSLSIDTSLIEALVGTYRDNQGRTLTVSRDGGHAKALINWHGPITHGYLGSDTEDTLLFGTMMHFDPSGFAKADKVAIERKRDGISALVLTIVETTKSIRFERVGE